MIIWSDALLRPDLDGYSRDQLISKGRFSATKPQALRKRLPDEWFTPLSLSLITRQNLEGVHTKQFIDDQFARDSIHAEYALATCSVHLFAALKALDEQSHYMAPVSGFHHASRDSAWGFCTFNGLMLTADELLKSGAVKKVVIIDGDTHFGDGCHNILCGWQRSTCDYYHAESVEAVEKALNDDHPAETIVLYQAGVDGHVDDPLKMSDGLTDEDYRRRDELLYTACIDRGWPSVTNLAGGYIDHSMDLYVQTAEILHRLRPVISPLD